MHPLRVLLLVSLVIALAVAWGLGSALHRAGVDFTGSLVLAIAAFGAFMIPWTGTFLWAVRRAADLDQLTERSREVAKGKMETAIGDRVYHGELDDLARAIEEIRASFVRQKRSWEEHRAAMEEIVSSLGEGLLAISPEGRIVVANRRVAEMFEAPQGSLAGRKVLEVVRKQSVQAALDRALNGEASTDRVTYGAGTAERQFEVRAFPVEASPEIAAVAIFIDVTTIERLQRIRKEFLDDFSHEVRTPLAGLRSAADTLERGGLTREYEVQLRHVMQRQIARIERLVTDLSELNRIESGQIVLQRSHFDLRDLLAELCEEYGRRNAAMQFRVVGEEVRVFADAIRLQQVFSNLLDNACRHGGGSGTVTIEVASEQEKVVVRVSDEGPGIPPDEVERIFNRFYRVDRSRSQPGTGLGLAIAKHLVVAHAGTIRALNRGEGGATFEVRLPAELT